MISEMYHRSMFSHLESVDMIRFKDEIVHGEVFTIACYMIASPELWKLPMAPECRGIVWNSQGECVSLPFHKFFNVGETQDTQEHVLPWDWNYNCAEKRDGSLITPVLVSTGIDKKVYFKSKKSFYSEVAIAAQNNAPVEVVQLCTFLLEKNLTPIFEYTSPNNEIVINYGTSPQFVLLAIRDNFNGKYSSPTSVENIAEKYGVQVIQNFGKIQKSELLEKMRNLENFEGYVIEFDNGVRVKMKTDWYLRLHKCRTELRERDVAKMCIDETLDDVKSAVSLAGLPLSPLEEIEIRVSKELGVIISNTEKMANDIRSQDSRKEAALKFGHLPEFGLAMKVFDGKIPNYKKFWGDKHLNQYTLNTIYSNFKSGMINGQD